MTNDEARMPSEPGFCARTENTFSIAKLLGFALAEFWKSRVFQSILNLRVAKLAAFCVWRM
jgi:hypothetical protein